MLIVVQKADEVERVTEERAATGLSNLSFLINLVETYAHYLTSRYRGERTDSKNAVD